MSVNDNNRPMSLGTALMDMLADMNDAQARIYRAGGTESDAGREVLRLEAMHRPRVLLTIRRTGDA